MKRKFAGTLMVVPNPASGASFPADAFAKGLGEIPGFIDRYELLRNVFKGSGIDVRLAEEVSRFAGDYFFAWATDNRCVIECLGPERAIEILELFAVHREIGWEFSDYVYWEALPETVEIFRGGVAPVNELLKGFSWTLSVSRARSFAEVQEQGIVVRAEISKADILLVSSLEGEVVPRPGALLHVKIVEDSY